MKYLLFFLSAVVLFLPPRTLAAESVQATDRIQIIMGTPVQLTTCLPTDSGAFDAAFNAVRDVDRHLSTWSPESELSMINNRAPGLKRIRCDEHLWVMLRESKKYYELSKGAFDPTVHPYIKAWGFEETPTVPDKKTLRDARSTVGFSKIHLKTHVLIFDNPGTQLNFGAIAKGYAADLAYEVLREKGVSCGMVNVGRTLLFWGGDSWKLDIQHPQKEEGNAIATLSVRDGAVSTSGQYEKTFEQDGKKYGHILDPRTGKPVENNLLSVTVVAPTATQADALSTACFVMGKQKGEKLIRKMKDVEAVFISRCDCGTPRIEWTKGLRGKIFSVPKESTH